MTVGDDVLKFGYDASGSPMYLQFNNSRYFYATNVQGDVTALVHTSGTAVVEYTYDAWGNILTITGSMADTVGQINPLRYRGYVYDAETKLYYLQSRYYDPAVGRFINADAFVSTGQGILGNNMFAYCLNNPTCYIDTSGAAAASIFTDDGEIYDESDLFDRGGSGSSWDVFISTLDSLANGFNMALGGGKNYPKPEMHHVVPYNNKKHSPLYEGIVVEYDFSLSSRDNIIPLHNHKGRHTEAYHEFILTALQSLHTYANGDKDAFSRGFSYIVKYVFEHPWLPYARK